MAASKRPFGPKGDFAGQTNGRTTGLTELDFDYFCPTLSLWYIKLQINGISNCLALIVNSNFPGSTSNVARYVDERRVAMMTGPCQLLGEYGQIV